MAGLLSELDSSQDVLNVEWNLNNSSLLDVKEQLPKICKYDGKLPPGLKLYSNQPVLLHKWYHKRKANVRTIYRDKTGPYYEVGQTLQVPDDYEGWFELVPPDFGRGGYYKTIEEVSKVMPAKFFSRAMITGIKVDDAKTGEQSYFQKEIPAGSVLKVQSVVSAKWRTSVETGLRKKKQKEYMTRDIQYLKCTDSTGLDLLIPFTTGGKFNPIYQTGNSDSKSLFRMKDILTDLTLPIKVRLLFGKPPSIPCIFTGMLIIKDSKTEDVIIGSTITFKRHALFELPVSSDINVSLAKSEDVFKSLKTYEDAELLCRKYSDSFSSLIKLSHDMDMAQQTIQHIPTEKSKQRNESLRTLDLITNISLTDDEPKEQLMESPSETTNDLNLTMGTLIELKELSRRSSMMC